MRAESGAAEPEPGWSTRAVHAGSAAPAPDAPVVTPIVQSTTFYTDAVPAGEVRYTRHGTNPNHDVLAAKLAALEGAEAALVLGSGMAAISLSLLALAGSGDHVVAPRALYGGTRTLLVREFPRLGIAVSFADGPAEVEAALRPATRALLLELPSNPTLRVPDLPGLAALARRRGVPLLVDATFATPVGLRPVEHGAAAALHSATKYLGGHSDVTAGVVAGDGALVAEVREKLKSFGAVLDPHAAWLLERGIKTLAVRYERQAATALELARRLERHPRVQRVHHPGLASHPDHARAAELLPLGCAMLAFVVAGGDEAALALLARLELARVAPSLGGVETLVSMPRYTSHAALTPAERAELGIEDGCVRISVGIEDGADLARDLERALG
jgi:cystathionine beta-lyase/cystathionine gamma-synthase